MSKKSEPKNKLSVHCLWGLLCSLSSLDQERNNLSLFNVIDQLNLPENLFPESNSKKPKPVNFEHEIVMVWRRIVSADIDDNELNFDLEITLIDPEGAELQQVLSSLKFGKGSRRTRIRIRTNLFLITSPGDYQYRIGVKDLESENFEPACTVPFEVQIKT